jgi:hypothetical protein
VSGRCEGREIGQRNRSRSVCEKGRESRDQAERRQGLTSLSEVAQHLRLNLKGKDLGRQSTGREVPDGEEEIWDATLSSNASDLALLVKSPDGVERLAVSFSDGRLEDEG